MCGSGEKGCNNLKSFFACGEVRLIVILDLCCCESVLVMPLGGWRCRILLPPSSLIPLEKIFRCWSSGWLDHAEHLEKGVTMLNTVAWEEHEKTAEFSFVSFLFEICKKRRSFGSTYEHNPAIE